MKISKLLNIKNLFQYIRIIWFFLEGNLLMRLHYDKSRVMGGKYYCRGRYGYLTSSIWKLVIDDYKACKRANVNRHIPWPVSSRIQVVNPENIIFHPDDLNNFQGFGNYYQAIGTIFIGRGTYIAPNVGIITANHSLENLDEHDAAKAVTIGEKCWIGMNSIILPGVVLGEHTVVGAGSVVTKSFMDGNCVIAGNPARIIRRLNNKEQESQ